MLYLVIILILLMVFAILFTQMPQFGKLPTGDQLEKIKASAHYDNGQFRNLSPTPDLTEGANLYNVLKEFLAKKERNIPTGSIPSIKTDLHKLDRSKDILIWFGHSSYFIQLDGKRILVDPVLSGAAAPVWFAARPFQGTALYSAEDLPSVDYLFITHDHWDHLDYKTVKKIQPSVGKIIAGLGTGAHLERWGYTKTQIIEKDWHETFELEEGFSVTTVPARHFSGRGLKRNRSLWMSYALSSPTMKIFIGGDSGFDTHFEKAGEVLGPFDLAILENGQYDKNWKYIHMSPEEVIMANKALQAKKLFPVHSGKFALANHDWDEPLRRISALSAENGIPLVTPRIGEIVHFKQDQPFAKWWLYTD